MEELLYRDFWNQLIMNSSVMNSLVMVSVMKEIDSRTYRPLIPALNAGVEDESGISYISYVRKYLSEFNS